ncbi:hypothetical protein [Rhodopseudomonas pseudopalustris]|jgi:hypothetical protein|uniref:Uncharacterized protein n=1 Tax=Rhodopseudomonas pseudopalustris TaxID=1513892 RepID=A0A1H8X0M5_9BRAD|nr:hypothetical protein [Rhodopseudomonas pseudopalustris]SEP33283.1 hypothetical protein SAMN05444123_11528 [Rhodopseudomonas pseudopalustris]
MASYYVPTVVQTTIPNTDMTPLERLVLSHMFDAEPDDDGLYFFAEESPRECIKVDAAELRAAHRDSADGDSVLDSIVGERLAESADAETHIELDLTVTSWATVFQDIVRRSVTLEEIAVSSAFTCSRMRPDGFGGMATLITADSIRSCSTDEALQQFREELATAAAPRTHVLLRFDESEVRTMIGEVITYDDALTTLSPDAITGDDVHAACLAVAAATQLMEEHGTAVFKAALAAIKSAEQRRAESNAGKGRREGE